MIIVMEFCRKKKTIPPFQWLHLICETKTHTCSWSQKLLNELNWNLYLVQCIVLCTIISITEDKCKTHGFIFLLLVDDAISVDPLHNSVILYMVLVHSNLLLVALTKRY